MHLGPVGALTVWTAVLLATYAGFVQVMGQLFAWSTPSLALGPWAAALHLASLAQQAWEWAPTLCWAAAMVYSVDAVGQLGLKVATLQDRVHAVEGRESQLMGKVQTLEGKVTTMEDRVTYLEDRLKVAGEARLGWADCTSCMLGGHLQHKQCVATLANLLLRQTQAGP